MATAARWRLLGLAALTTAAAAVALVPEFYHRWWWWDVFTHATIAGLLAVWRHELEVPPRWAWPALLAGMLAWEWLEITTPLLFSPSRADVLKDLTVNLVAYWSVGVVLARDLPASDDASVFVPDR